MEAIKYFIFIFLVGISACENRKWNNPFDPECPKEIFTPTGFEAEQQGYVVKLSWSLLNTRISGYKIERKVGNNSWIEVVSLDKSINTWNDNAITNGELHNYRIYAFAGQNESNRLSTQITPLIVSVATTLAATNTGTTYATLNGKVNPHGALTTVTFEYGETAAYGQTVTASQSPLTGTTEINVSATISGLTTGKTYHYRVKAVNSGSTAHGSDLTFNTKYLPPTAITIAVTNHTSNSVTLNGSVNPNGASTIVFFEFGETTSYGFVKMASQSPVTGNNIIDVSTFISGLTSGITYHFRVCAGSAGGESCGSDMTFVTISSEGENVTDIDGNVYQTITIGTQIWMAENLKTTKYNDGTSIPNVTDNSDWTQLTTGAYCWYNNDIENKAIYGALYNWHAVNTGKLCPDGWHVPTSNEWFILDVYLGYGTTNTSGKLISTTGWNSSPTWVTNSSGFTALPGGRRYPEGLFTGIGDSGYWWSSTESTNESSVMIFLGISSEGILGRGTFRQNYGFSIRCIKD